MLKVSFFLNQGTELVPWLVIKHPLALGYLTIKCQYLSLAFSKLPTQKSLFSWYKGDPMAFTHGFQPLPCCLFCFLFFLWTIHEVSKQPSRSAFLLFLPKFSNSWNTVSRSACAPTDIIISQFMTSESLSNWTTMVPRDRTCSPYHHWWSPQCQPSDEGCIYNTSSSCLHPRLLAPTFPAFMLWGRVNHAAHLPGGDFSFFFS